MSPSSYSIAHGGAIPQEPRALDQWVIRDEQKRPINPATGKLASPTDSTTWSSFTTAAATGRPLGFVFTEDDPYVGIDLDHCRDPETDAIAPEAMVIIDRFATYAEISPSGTGIHIIGRGVKPTRDCTMKTTWGKIECYDHGRYFTMTGNSLAGHDTIRNFQRELTAWHSEVWPVEPERPKPPPPTYTTTDTRLTNEQILETAFRAKNGDSIRRLYDGDISGYAASQSDPRFSSEADLALVSRLSFYTSDDEQLADLWRSSGLYRKKLDRNDYIQRTINKVRSGQSAFYSPGYASQTRAPEPPPRGASCDAQLAATRAELAEARQSIIVLQDRVRVADERRVTAEERAERLSLERSRIMEILRCPDLPAGQRLTHFMTVVELGARVANGEEQPDPGYKLPAIRIAEKTGQSPQTVRSHWKALDKIGVIQKTNVRERTHKDSVDQETGEVVTVDGMREVTHIRVPENNIINLIDRFTGYERQETDKQHGGTRTPKPVCDLHPEAGTFTLTVIECAQCHDELSRSAGVYQEPASDESSGINLIGEQRVGKTVLRDTKLIGEIRRRSPTILNGEPPPGFDYQDHDAPHWVAS